MAGAGGVDNIAVSRELETPLPSYQPSLFFGGGSREERGVRRQGVASLRATWGDVERAESKPLS